MGRILAEELAGTEFITLGTALAVHLQGNHYPPVPTSMVKPCINAIYAVNEGAGDTEIYLPDGITYKGEITAPAWAIVEQHHLDAWVQNDDE